VVGALALILILMLVLGSGGGSRAWVPASLADGSWTTSVIVFGPQVSVVETWQNQCESRGSAAVRAETCVLRDTDRYRDAVVDEYEEYAYDIYYEETTSQVYEARGTEFVLTQLGADEWWEGNRRYSREEQVDQDSCKLSTYTVWIDDPSDPTQEVETYLAQCQVWDAVTVTERVYEQAPWCQCEVTSLAPMGQVSDQGSGASVRWPGSEVPLGGRAEEQFRGQVTFVADDYRYTVTTDDPDEYQQLVTGQYYIEVRNGQPAGITANPPES
jgi:hypothetical protein